MTPEGNPELPDNGLPEDQEEDDCVNTSDIFRMPKENLPDE